jgi:aspartate aminotransferase-like enzyme
MSSNSDNNVPKVEGSEFYEYSVIYTDRAMNLMASPFRQCMRDISASLKRAYNCSSVAIIPGSGTYGMEAIARQFGTNKKCLVIRNGYFSFRWSDIFNVTQIPKGKETVLMASPINSDSNNNKMSAFAPMDIDKVCSIITTEKPDAVFLPHVETSTGILLPDSYIKRVADAAHKYGSVVIVDAIAAGTIWLDMKATGVDVCLSAPQKGWSGPACCAFVMLNKRARKITKDPTRQPRNTSFCCNLMQWLDVMEQYENINGDGPGFKYYTTLPTDALMKVRDAINETEAFGFDNAKEKCFQLGKEIRQLLLKHGYPSLAAPRFEAPGVVVSYSNMPAGTNMVKKFKSVGIQIAGGVPLKLDEDTKYGIDTKASTFRIGLFGLDKIKNIHEVVKRLDNAISKLKSGSHHTSLSHSKI